MNRLLILLALIALPAAPALAAGVGDTAPALALTTPAGEKINLTEHHGQVVYLDFWASWCTPCRKSFPWMNSMQEKYRAQGLLILAVNLDEARADAERFLAETPASFTVVLDPKGESARSWKVKGMPTSYLIGRQGRLLAIHTGFRDHEADSRERQIVDALAASH